MSSKIEGLKTQILATVPPEEKAVLEHLRKSTEESSDFEDLLFEITGARYQLLGSLEQIVVKIKPDLSLATVAIDFREATFTMGITNPPLCFRSHLFEDAYDQFVCGDVEVSEIAERMEKFDQTNTLTMVERKHPGDFLSPHDVYRLPHHIVIEKGNSGEIIFEPTSEIINGIFRPKLVVDAYLLHTLDRQMK